MKEMLNGPWGPEVFFSAEWLADPPAHFCVELPGPPEGAKEGDECDLTGGIVKVIDGPAKGRVWRLTGVVDDCCGYQGLWPD